MNEEKIWFICLRQVRLHPRNQKNIAQRLRIQWLRKYHLEQAAVSGSRHTLWLCPRTHGEQETSQCWDPDEAMPGCQSMFMDCYRISTSPVEEEAFCFPF